LRKAFAQASYRVPALRSASQAGLVNNLNDGLAWGLVPLFLAANGAGVAAVGLVAARGRRCRAPHADPFLGTTELGLALLVSLGFIAWAGRSLSARVAPRPASA
jgi:hypothetical protein